MPNTNIEHFTALIKPVAETIAQSAIDSELETRLNDKFPPTGKAFKNIEHCCLAAIKAGWMCKQGSEGRRFGRVLEPSSTTNDLSVDVVDLTDIVGPHHRHPTGEICMVMPVTSGAQFDNQDAGWCVNPPGSAHHPTVTNGRALVLYFLPDGKIEFSK